MTFYRTPLYLGLAVGSVLPLLIGLYRPMAYAADVKPSVGGGETSTAASAAAAGADTPDPADDTAAGPASPRPKKKSYRRSRLTRDESEAQADHRKLVLATGEDKAVDLDFDALEAAKGVAVGNPQVVFPQVVTIDGKKQIIFKPLKSGETTVTLRDTSGNIKLIFEVHVTGTNLLNLAAEIRDLLRDIEGVDIRIVGQKIIVDGQVLVPSDYGRLISVVGDKAYSDVVLNLATLSPLAMQVLARKIQEDINKFAQNVTTRVVNGIIFLEGQVDNFDLARRAVEIAKLYLPEVKPANQLAAKDQSAVSIPRPLIQNFILVNAPPPKKQEKLVRVTVHYVELSKDYSKVFGFKWAPGFTSDPTITIGSGSDGQTATSGTSFAATISSLFPKLQSAQDAGYARVLRTGTVIVRSGQQAELNEGEQIPFTRLGPNGQPVGDAIDIGLSLAVTPQILGQSEDIQLDLDMNQSASVGTTTGGAPIKSNHKVKTKIYVKSSESAAVAGVNSSDIGTDFNKDDPAAGSFASTNGQPQTSPLFSLLHSKKYRKKKSQFVIFITPQIIENASEGTEDLKRNFRVKVQ